jgi:hypothetical protein
MRRFALLNVVLSLLFVLAASGQDLPSVHWFSEIPAGTPIPAADRVWHDGPPPVAAFDFAAAATPKVNLVYLVPTDKQVKQNYVTSMDAAVRSLIRWYAGQTTNHKTFGASSPTVVVVSLPHDSNYYANNPRPAIFTQFWDNVLNDALPLTNGHFNDPLNTWAYYIDADPICNECGGCGTSGILLVSANDLRGLAGESSAFTDPCTSNKPFPYPPPRWIGGLGHELGHAFGLPHPPGCDDGNTAIQCDTNALMWAGYAAYPNTFLRDDNKAVLLNSPFFIFNPPVDRVRSIKH